MISLLVMTDGRDEYLDQAVASAQRWLMPQPAITQLWMHDDTGDGGYRVELARRYPQWTHINGGPRRGFGGAIQSAWSQVSRNSATRFVFHLEADFIFQRGFDLEAMARVLDTRRYLTQLALRRQPWNDAERAAGGIVEQHPDAYVDASDDLGHEWLEHRLFFTTNPCLYRHELMSRGWPDGAQSEGHFGLRLFADDPDARSAFWGGRHSGLAVEHIGHTRTGTGY